MRTEPTRYLVTVVQQSTEGTRLTRESIIGSDLETAAAQIGEVTRCAAASAHPYDGEIVQVLISKR